jgi:hypothetical protein
VPRQAPAATEAEAAVPAEVAQGPAPAGGSRAVVVEVPDDDYPLPGWDQWASFPTLSPESQEGALVRRCEGHMVAGAEGMAPRPRLPALATTPRWRELLAIRPRLLMPRGSRSCGESSAATAPRSTVR